MGTGNATRFELGTRVYYDDNPGRVTGLTYDTNYDWTLGALVKVKVRWDNDTETEVSPADILNESEYRDFCEEFGK